MPKSELPLIIVVGDSVDPGLVTQLTDSRLRVEVHSLLGDITGDSDIVIIDGTLDVETALASCRSHRARFGAEGPSVIFLASSQSQVRRQALENGADACLSKPYDFDELRSQVTALLRLREAMNRMRDKAAVSNQIYDRLQQAYAQNNLDLELARRLQTSFLPRHLPEIGKVRFAVWSKPHGVVGGDFYDVIRLDERHVAFFLADAMGHGVPACLLTIYLKKAVTCKEIHPGGYRLLPPDEVLSRLNRDLIEQNIPEQPFITMAYGLVDCMSGELSLSRAAAQHPIVIPQSGPPEVWKLSGTLLGVFEASFQTKKRVLGVGDRLLLMTDGLSADLADPQAQDFGPVFAAIQAAQSGSLQELVDSVAGNLTKGIEPHDDLTLLALELA